MKGITLALLTFTTALVFVYHHFNKYTCCLYFNPSAEKNYTVCSTCAANGPCSIITECKFNDKGEYGVFILMHIGKVRNCTLQECIDSKLASDTTRNNDTLYTQLLISKSVQEEEEEARTKQAIAPYSYLHYYLGGVINRSTHSIMEYRAFQHGLHYTEYLLYIYTSEFIIPEGEASFKQLIRHENVELWRYSYTLWNQKTQYPSLVLRKGHGIQHLLHKNNTIPRK
jgi:hypothetical protein